MKQYSNYKPSNIDWIGDIPVHWDVKKLKYLAEVVLGKMLTPDSKAGYELKPYLRSANVQWMQPDLSSVKEMWFSGDEMEKFRLHENDLVVNEGGEVGRTCIWRNEIEECYIQNSVHKISMLNSYNASYALYSFFFFGQQGHFDAVVNRISIAHLTGEKLKEVSFVVPPLAEQVAIATYLDEQTAQLDGLIARKRRLMALLREEKAALINEAVTKGIRPNVPTKPSGIDWLGDVPAHWEIGRVKHVCKIQGRIGFKGYKTSDLVPFGEGAMTLGSSHITKTHKIDISEPVYLNWEKYYESPEIMVRKGDIVFSQRGAYLGKVGLIEENFGEVTINPSLILLKEIMIEASYLAYYLTSGYIAQNVNIISNSTAIPMISQDQLSNFYCLIPPIEEQRTITQYINEETAKIDFTVGRIEREIELMQEYRTALISEVVTGKVKVV